MKRILVLALCAGVAMTACAKEELSESVAAGAMPTQAPATEAAAPPAADASRSDAPIARREETATPASIPLLAYRYLYRIEAPAKSIDLLVGKHEAACQAAGPSVCQVTQADVRHESERRVTGTLSLRARPDWLAAFRAGLAADAEGVDGKILASNTGTDDLSGSIVDTEAAIRAKVILRNRLEDIMARRTGKLDDILEAERQLAEVRSQIDAAQSSLAMMKNRVRMASLTIEYGPKGSLASDGAWAPVADAVRTSQDVMANVISALILAIAALAPVGALGAFIWLLVARLRKGRRTAAESAASAPAAP